MSATTAQLRDSVQYNCDISDARFARDYSMCVYLLRMQEFYRWKESIPLDSKIDGELLGNWVRDTETYWDSIEDNDFKPLTIDGTDYDPFNADTINQQLAQSGLVYTAGIGRLGQPHFVLANCEDRTDKPHPKIEFGNELARDSITLPAMTCNGTVYIRHDAIVRMLWHMIDDWRLHRLHGPMRNVVEHYGLDTTDNQSQHIESAARDISPLLTHHEYGEIRATEHLGEQYAQLIIESQGYRAEAYLRAVRDLYADSLGSWQYIVTNQSKVHLDFWLAGLIGIREELFESTSLYSALTTSTNPIEELSRNLQQEQKRWHHVAQLLAETVKREGLKCDYPKIIEEAIKINNNEHLS